MSKKEVEDRLGKCRQALDRLETLYEAGKVSEKTYQELKEYTQEFEQLTSLSKPPEIAIERPKIVTKKSSRKKYAIVIVIIAVLTLFPTPHSRTRQEPYTTYETVTKTDWLTTYPCNDFLEHGQSWIWELPDLPKDNLKIIVNMYTHLVVEVMIKSTSGIISQKRFSWMDELYCKNWWTVSTSWSHNPHNEASSFVEGDIKVYHEYETQIPVTKYRTVQYTEWLPWWMR